MGTAYRRMDEDDMFTMDDGASAAPTDPLDAKFEAQCGVQGEAPKAWTVNNTKQWVMEELGTGSIQDCRVAMEAAMSEAEALSKKAKGKKERPFFYVTSKGEPPEMETEPFTSMTYTAFPVYCDCSSIAALVTLDGVRALE